MLQSKKIVILCYSFPPNPGVGGRRWVKFAKYLNKLGHQVEVITSAPTKNSSSAYDKDVLPAIKTHFFKSKSPTYADGNCKNFVEKLKYRWWLIVNSLFYKGNIYDGTIRDEAAIKKVLFDVLKNVDVFIASGAPFHMCHYAFKYTKKLPKHVLKILDIRDPWANGSQFGMKLLSSDKFHQEQVKELETLKATNVMISPHDHVVAYYNKLGSCSNNILLENGFDDDDFELVYKNEKSINNTINICYGGALYYSKNELVNFFQRCSEVSKNQSIYVTIFNNEIQEKIVHENVIVDYRPSLPVAKFIAFQAQSDIVLNFRPAPYENWMSSKTAEVFLLKKPILNFGPSGVIAKTIQDGYGTNVEDVVNESVDLGLLKNYKVKTDIPSIIQKLNIKNLTFELEEIIGSNIQNN